MSIKKHSNKSKRLPCTGLFKHFTIIFLKQSKDSVCKMTKFRTEDANKVVEMVNRNGKTYVQVN